jgi:hypothetical protein
MTTEQKDVEFYAAQVNAWLTTRFEHDRSLLTLSAGGIGVLITVALATGIKNSATLVIYCAALFSFVICLSTVLWIFRRNADHLERAVAGESEPDGLLALLDKAAIASFLCGVLLASLMGVSAAFDSLIEKKKHEMTEQKKQNNGTPAYDSVNGVTKMQPQWIEKSVNSINNMKPAPQQTPQPAPQNPPAATPENGK